MNKITLSLLLSIICTGVFAQTSSPATLIHFWHFNNLASFVPGQALPQPDSSKIPTGARLTYFQAAGATANWDTVGGSGATTLNGYGVGAGFALRLRNPADSFILHLPTTGYLNVVLSYATTRTKKGAQVQNVYYSTNGSTYQLFNQTVAVDTVYQVTTLNFSNVAQANNNPNFKVKIEFANGNTGNSGNDRFDNIRLEGTALTAVSPKVSDRAWNIVPNPVSSGTEVQFGAPVIGRVVNSLGKTVANLHYSESFNTEGLSAGLYFVINANGNSRSLVIK
jgi:hypothetical protein